MKSHSDACHGDVRTESFSDAGEFPECAQRSGLVPVEQSWPHGSDVRARANDQQQARQQGLEIEDRRHNSC